MCNAWKKVIGLASCIATLAMCASAQNTFPSSGSVGIGTTSPSSELDVNGSGSDAGGIALDSLSNLAYAHNRIYAGTAPSSGFNIHFGDTVLGHGYNLNFLAGGTSHVLTLQDNGYIGIGTSTPATRLEVNGNVQVDGYISASQGFNAAGSGDPSAYNTLSFTSGWGPISWGATSNASNGWGTTIWSWQPDNSNNGANLAFATGNGTTVLPNSNIRMLINSQGYVGIGTTTPAAKLELNGSMKLTSGSGASITFPDATVQSTAWNGTTLGGDYAESVDVEGNRSTYEPGDVIVIGDSETERFEKSDTAYSRMVAGVYSTKPGLVGRRTTSGRPDKNVEVPMAMIGIVPTKVTSENGIIHRGDLLVTSSTPGYAMKGTDQGRMLGAIIGKALTSLNDEKGIIEVLVTLQ